MRSIVRFQNTSSVPNKRNIRIRIVDTSRVGADAVVVNEMDVPIPQGFDPQTQDIPFEMVVPDNQKGLTVQAHLAAHDGTDIRKGDMITTTAIPVPERQDEAVVILLQTI